MSHLIYCFSFVGGVEVRSDHLCQMRGWKEGDAKFGGVAQLS